MLKRSLIVVLMLCTTDLEMLGPNVLVYSCLSLCVYQLFYIQLRHFSSVNLHSEPIKT